MNKTSCQWRNLLHDYPVWQTAYYYYRVWAAEVELKKMLDVLTQQVRLWEGQPPQPSIAVIDSQSVKSAAIASDAMT